jgi:hypothetical protein
VSTLFTRYSHDDDLREVGDSHYTHFADAIGTTLTACGRELHDLFLGVVVLILLV